MTHPSKPSAVRTLLRLLQRLAPSPEQLPDAVFLELVDMPFSSLIPVVVIDITVTCMGLLVAAMQPDFAVLCLTIACTPVTIARVLIILAYRKRRKAAPMTADEARIWERWNGVGSYAFAVLLGSMCALGFTTDNGPVQMLMTGLLFGYGGGVMTGLAVRPVVCVTTIMLATVPAVIGVGVHIGTAMGFYGRAAYAEEMLLIMGFAFIGMKTAMQVYRTTLQQLLSKQELAALAGHDALTGLPNRILLRARFNEGAELSRRTSDLQALHCLDLDKFKAVNDIYGHPTGDALLCAVADRLAGTLQAGDTVARVGGDEFVVVQNSIRNADEARFLAHRIIRVVSAPYRIDGHEIHIGVSIGIALAPHDGLDLGQLSARADRALYAAKCDRGGVVAFWGELAARPATTTAA